MFGNGVDIVANVAGTVDEANWKDAIQLNLVGLF